MLNKIAEHAVIGSIFLKLFVKTKKKYNFAANLYEAVSKVAVVIASRQAKQSSILNIIGLLRALPSQ